MQYPNEVMSCLIALGVVFWAWIFLRMFWTLATWKNRKVVKTFVRFGDPSPWEEESDQ